MSSKAVFSTAYLAPIEYFATLIKYQEIFVEQGEHYVKQTYRNRCLIYTANGLFPLSIPVKKVNGNHTKVKDVEISYFENWQRHHWRSIVSAYNQSPFFLYYRDDLEGFYSRQFKYLLDFNTQLIKVLLDALGLEKELAIPEKYIENNDPDYLDLRNQFDPKKKNANVRFPKYIQVFAEKHGFIPNLSIIDLLFNEGPNALGYLTEVCSNN
ncbi:MAG: WbqC family protein [Chlorobi bacterium]|nr:WbqC family protein [Chlorobiota bacterium]